MVVVESYPDTYSKVALALTSAQVAKESLVAEFGVGEDLPFNFFGWLGGDCAVGSWSYGCVVGGAV